MAPVTRYRSRRALITALVTLTAGFALSTTVATEPAQAQQRPACGKAADRVPSNARQARRAERVTRCLVNQRRAARGVNRLRHAPRLTRSSRGHSRFMVRNSCFAHQCPGGPNLVQRVRGAGYLLANLLGWRVGENIAWGTRSRATPRAIVRAWMRSPGHRQNLLDGRYREFGMGVVLGAPAQGNAPGGTYTNNFGTRSR